MNQEHRKQGMMVTVTVTGFPPCPRAERFNIAPSKADWWTIAMSWHFRSQPFLLATVEQNRIWFSNWMNTSFYENLSIIPVKAILLWGTWDDLNSCGLFKSKYCYCSLYQLWEWDKWMGLSSQDMKAHIHSFLPVLASDTASPGACDSLFSSPRSI